MKTLERNCAVWEKEEHKLLRECEIGLPPTVLKQRTTRFKSPEPIRSLKRWSSYRIVMSMTIQFYIFFIPAFLESRESGRP